MAGSKAQNAHRGRVMANIDRYLKIVDWPRIPLGRKMT